MTPDCFNQETQQSDADCNNRTWKMLDDVGNSGWKGVKVFLNGDTLAIVFSMPTTTYTEYRIKTGVNGGVLSEGTIFCYPNHPSGMCTQLRNNKIEIPSWDFAGAPCKLEGDTYFVEVTGPGLNFREDKSIPQGNLACPSRPLGPSPFGPNYGSPSPSPEPVVVTPTPESSPSPDSSSEPTISPSPESSSEPTTSPSPTP
jgi:hypothetical protein